MNDYESYQRRLTVENAEHYLEERQEYEENIENYIYLLEDIKDIVFGDESYGNSEERIKQLKEVLKEND